MSLVSLQKGEGSEQLEKLSGLALNLGPELTDLADTAAVIRCLALIITVDTAVAHLACALGSPAWVTLPNVPDCAGCSSGKTARGIPPCVCSVNLGLAIGTMCLLE